MFFSEIKENTVFTIKFALNRKNRRFRKIALENGVLDQETMVYIRPNAISIEGDNELFEMDEQLSVVPV